MNIMTSKRFSSLSKRDFENGAVRDEIWRTLKYYEERTKSRPPYTPNEQTVCEAKKLTTTTVFEGV